MNDIIYKELIFEEDRIINLYLDNNWTSYTNTKELLYKGIKNSLYSLGAYDDEKLVGLVRVVGDGNTIIYIQDILVLNDYQNNGIGSQLINDIVHKYKSVRQIVLTTDNTDLQKRFYEKNGFKNYTDASLVAYMFKK